MADLLAIALVAGLWLAIEVIWSPPSSLGWFPDRFTRPEPAADGGQPETAGYGTGEADQTNVDWELHNQQFVRRRLDALAEELDRLDREPDVFAKAFHTMVARAAHDALLADASRLADRAPRYAGPARNFEVGGASTGRSEELAL